MLADRFAIVVDEKGGDEAHWSQLGAEVPEWVARYEAGQAAAPLEAREEGETAG